MLRVCPGSKMPNAPLSLPNPLSPEVQLVQFHQPDIFNYSALLLSEDEDTLYVGAREAVFALNALDVSQKQHEVWPGLPCGLGHRSFQCFFPRIGTFGSSWGIRPSLGYVAHSPRGWPHRHPGAREQPPSHQ